MSDVIGAGSAGRLLNILVQKAHWAVLRCVCVCVWTPVVMAKTTAHQDLFRWRSAGAMSGQTNPSVCVQVRREWLLILAKI